ncbi:MAG: hypothetical protein LBM28_05180 [Oscillospiraceae bacterium]|jgi:hypothetical protein|nr:hypothetical protein [Oscillospiraceae bacterium]
MKITQRIAKIIRIITTAPFAATFLCTLLLLLDKVAFRSYWHYAAALFFLALLPLMAYPTAALVPSIKKKGRKGQRNLAVIFSVIGYIGGFLFALLAKGTPTEEVLYCTYLISGAGIAVCTVFRFKVSGHACGISGPVAKLVEFVGPWFLFGYILLIPTIWSSLKLKRHSILELLAGTILPWIALYVSMAIFL